MYTYKGVKGVKGGSNIKRISNTYTYRGVKRIVKGTKGAYTKRGQRLGCLVDRYAGRTSKTYTFRASNCTQDV